MKTQRTLFRLIKERFKTLQKGPFRRLVAVAGSIHQSIKYLSPVRIYVDEEGDWRNRRRGISLASPELNVASWHEVQSAASDYWCHDYKPVPGDTVVDIGAGIGDDTLAFSRLVGASGRVIAVEAHPRTYRCLLKTIEANGLTNVVAVNAAVTDSQGVIAISNGDQYLSNSVHDGGCHVEVPACTLEDILQKTGNMRADLVKMNIEGAETAALRGMSGILRAIPHVVVSCHDFKAERGESEEFRTLADVRRLLHGAGYRVRERKNDPRPEVRNYLYGTHARNESPASP